MLMQHTVMIHDDKLFVSTAISVHYSAVLQHHPFHLLYLALSGRDVHCHVMFKIIHVAVSS